MAPWSLRLALLGLQLVLVGVLLHRFGSLPTPVALNLLAVGFASALLGLVLAGWALCRIWRFGETGAGRSVAAALLVLGLLAWPTSYVAAFFGEPALNDITTDPVAPPTYVKLSELRSEGANPAAYAGPDAAERQFQAFPDIEPIVTDRGPVETFEIVRATLDRMGLEVVSAEAPAGRGSEGRLEAVDRTLVMGFADDIAIRVRGAEGSSRVDIRSSARFGRHDFGRNAKRVRMLMREVQARLEQSIPGEEDQKLAEDEAKSKAGGKSPSASAARSKKSARARSSARYEPKSKGKQPRKRSRRSRDTPLLLFGR